MDIKVNVKRGYKVDGVEYDSLDAMPAELRQAVELATAAFPEAGARRGAADPSPVPIGPASSKNLPLRLLLILAGVLLLWLGWFFLKGLR